MASLSRFRPVDDWIDQIFASISAREGGIVRRSVLSVEREIGRGRLELEVRRRGYHLIEAEEQFIIICNSAPLRIIC
jgi:hypothetical protein